MADDQSEIHLYRSDTSLFIFVFIIFVGLTFVMVYAYTVSNFNLAYIIFVVFLAGIDGFFISKFAKIYDFVMITPESIRIMNEKKNRVIQEYHENDLAEIQILYYISHYKGQVSYKFSLKLIDKQSKSWNYGSFIVTQNLSEFKAYVEDTYQYLLKNFKVQITKQRHSNNISESLEL